MNRFFNSILPKSSDRIVGLDLMRAIAISMVVFFHSWAFISQHLKNSGSLFFIGFWGVEFFFVLSGFLVGGIFITAFKNNDEKINASFLLSFWKRRWKRTIPIYIIVVIVNFLLFKWVFKIATEFPFQYFVFSQNLWSIHPNFFAEAWSLSVEEWFYISLPICFIIFQFINKQKSNFSITLFIIFLILLFASIRINLVKESFNLLQWDYGIRKVVVYRLDSILYGVLFFVLISTNRPFYKSKRYHLFFVGLLLLLLSYYLFYLKLFPIYNTVFFLSINSLAISLTIPFFYFFEFRFKSIKNIVSIISVVSYSMYLIHYTFVYRLFDKYLLNKNIKSAIVHFIFYLLVVSVLSILIHKYIEKPLITKREKR